MLKTKGIIFDLDGVITDTAEYHYLAWKSLGEELGIAVRREFNESLKGISRMESLDRILELGNKERQYSIEEKIGLAEKKNGYYLERIASITQQDILPGVIPLLQACRRAGLKIGLASASHNAPFILDKLGIRNYFDVIVDPASLAKGKPDPEIFLTAAKLLHISPESCVGVEDAEAGIEAINRAGMYSIGVGDSNILSHADYVVTSLLELQLEDLV